MKIKIKRRLPPKKIPTPGRTPRIIPPKRITPPPGKDLRRIQEENDIKEMLGDRYADYKAEMAALGPIKRPPRSSGFNTMDLLAGDQGWEEQQAQRRAIRVKFGIDSANDPMLAQITGEKSPLQQFRESRDNKKIDDLISQYGSFDNYQNQMREQSRKRQIEAVIRSGDVDSAMALEDKFKQEDADREAKKIRLAEFEQRYGITPKPVMDDRERFRQSLGISKPPQRNIQVPMEGGNFLGGLLGDSSAGALDPLGPGLASPTRPTRPFRPGFDSTGMPLLPKDLNEPVPPGMKREPIYSPMGGKGQGRKIIGYKLVLDRPATIKEKQTAFQNLGGSLPPGLREQMQQQLKQQAQQQPAQQPAQPIQKPVQQAQPAAQQQPQPIQKPVQQPVQQAQAPQQPVQQTTIGPQQQYQQTQNQMYQTQPTQQQQPAAQQQPNQQQETEEEKRKRLEAATIGGASPFSSIT